MIEVKLKQDEENFLIDFVNKGLKKARQITRGRILLLANKRMGDSDIARVLDIGRNTVWRIKKKYLEKGLEYALNDETRPGQPIKYTETHKAEIIAQACTKPPEGRKRWTLVLLRDEMRKKEGFETINKESIRLILKKPELSLG